MRRNDWPENALLPVDAVLCGLLAAAVRQEGEREKAKAEVPGLPTHYRGPRLPGLQACANLEW